MYSLDLGEGSLQAIREKQALTKALQMNQYTELHMGVEDQAMDDNFKEQSIKLMTDESLRKWPRDFWDGL